MLNEVTTSEDFSNFYKITNGIIEKYLNNEDTRLLFYNNPEIVNEFIKEYGGIKLKSLIYEEIIRIEDINKQKIYEIFFNIFEAIKNDENIKKNHKELLFRNVLDNFSVKIAIILINKYKK